MYFAPAYWL